MSLERAEVTSQVAVDPENPWLGLSSYSEETRAYFHGRDDETAELARRVQRKLLTVLFGQSGLGKTSLIKAGLVPRLRSEAHCPVYVRIDYSAEAPSPSEQIKRAIFRATAAAGHWTRPGSAVEGESLWEFLHHRGDLLRDSEGRTLLPLLIFDQFEEIFTLGQSDEAGRRRAKLFLSDLADLVENRPPAALEERLDRDETDAEQYDFARADYRILIALREDYLAHLEGVKDIMPSITQNRMRLARMNGEQALSAVLKPGGALVSNDVAESIVRFVAGGSTLESAEVEPSLLSLVCRELNTVRLAQGRTEISADLLAGSRDTILGEFYERALADQPEGVRRVIEDELLTESGYRESLAEERVQKALAAVGASPDALATLVDRRLLRIEERLDVRRVELTHDVLCGIVRASRNLRHEREARDEAERQLARQREREAETHRTLVRTRMVAGICAALMFVAIASAVFGWVSLRRARAADAEAQKSRLLAESARADAEKLVGFLIEDFYYELEPTGRLETMGKLAHLAVNYYDSLPAELVTPRTELYRAMAIVREGSAQAARGDERAATGSFHSAQQVLERLHAADAGNEDVTFALGLTIFSRFSAGFLLGARGAEDLSRGADLLRPLAHAPDGSRRAKILYADVLNYLSHTQGYAQAVDTCEEARKILASIGALDMTDLRAASVYADVSDSEARHSLILGRIALAEKLEREVYDVAEKVLERRPGDLRSMANRALAAELLGRLAVRRYDYGAATAFAARAAQAGEDYVRFNPSDLNAWQYWIRGREQQVEYLVDQGRVTKALQLARGTVALQEDPRKPSSLNPLLVTSWMGLANLEARAGQREASARTWRAARVSAEEFLQTIGADDPRRPFFEARRDGGLAQTELYLGNFETAHGSAEEVVRNLDAHPGANESEFIQSVRNVSLGVALLLSSNAALHAGKAAEAELVARRRMAMEVESPLTQVDPQFGTMRARALFAHALVQQNRAAEARTALKPALEFYRARGAAGARGVAFETDHAYVEYVHGLAATGDGGGSEARDALDKAATLVDALPAEAKALVDVRELANRIAAARGGSSQ